MHSRYGRRVHTDGDVLPQLIASLSVQIAVADQRPYWWQPSPCVTCDDAFRAS